VGDSVQPLPNHFGFLFEQAKRALRPFNPLRHRTQPSIAVLRTHSIQQSTDLDSSSLTSHQATGAVSGLGAELCPSETGDDVRSRDCDETEPLNGGGALLRQVLTILTRDLYTASQGLPTLRVSVYISSLVVEKQTSNSNKWVWRFIDLKFSRDMNKNFDLKLMKSAITRYGVNNIVITL